MITIAPKPSFDLLVVIVGLGLVFECVVFQALEARSVARWGILRAGKA